MANATTLQQATAHQIWQPFFGSSASNTNEAAAKNSAAAVAAVAAAPVVVANSIEQLLLAQSAATASIFQAAALANSVSAADLQLIQHRATTGGTRGSEAAAATTSDNRDALALTDVAAAYTTSLPSSSGDEDVALEHVRAYTVEEPSSDSSSGSGHTDTAMDDGELDFLCELLSEQSDDEAIAARSTSPLQVQLGWSSTSAASLTAGAVSPTCSPVGSLVTVLSSSDIQAAVGAAAAGGAGSGIVAANELTLDQFLSAYDDLRPASILEQSRDGDTTASASQVTFNSPASGPVGRAPALEHAGSIDDILVAAASPASSVATVTIAETTEDTMTSPAAKTTTQVEGSTLHAAVRAHSVPSKAAKRSPRLTMTRRTLSAPTTYKITLPDSDETDRSTASSGNDTITSITGGDGQTEIRRHRGSRGKKKNRNRPSSDSVATPGSGAGGGRASPTYDKDSHRYRRRRDQNNEAVRRCRQRTKEKYEESVKHAASLQAQNTALRDRLVAMEKDMSSLRHRLASTQLGSASPLAGQRFAHPVDSSGSGSSSDEEILMTQPLPTSAAATTSSAGSLWEMLINGEL
ncbi:mucin-19-like [Sycon ciliatum]|uniref:mucin-19-like n=1 Tax=Sycon ciliatum TaxID=27933 RepID=UPI0020A9AEDB|eukprot:scpid45707/ scgid14331/ 